MILILRYLFGVPFIALCCFTTWRVFRSRPYDNSYDNVTVALAKTRPQRIGKNYNLFAASVTPVLVLACNRPKYLRRVLNQLFRLAKTEKYDVVISHGCNNDATEQVARSFSATYIKQPDQSPIFSDKQLFGSEGYQRVCRHYQWALDKTINILYPEAQTIVVLEDDLDLSNDLFDYFDSLRDALLSNENLLCVSGFNDNGKPGNVDMNNPCRLWWTDFFPGLGWMATTKLIRELLPKWPKTYWDDWLREPEQRKGRVCIRPEIAKTTTFGKAGVSVGQFFDKHLAKILLNTKQCRYNSTSVKQERYQDKAMAELHRLEVVNILNIDKFVGSNKSVKMLPETVLEWEEACSFLNIMEDIRGGVARNSFKGIVPTMYKGIRVFIVQPRTPRAGRNEIVDAHTTMGN